MSQPDSSLEAYFESADKDARSPQRGTLRKLATHFFREKGLFAFGILLICLATAATLLEPRLIGYAIDEAIVPRRWESLKRLSLFFLAVECVRVAAVISHGYLFERIGQNVMQRLRVMLFSQLQSLPVETYDRTPVGRLITRVTNDIAAMAEMFSAGFILMIGNILVVLGIIVWLVVLDWRLACVAISVFPILAAASIRFSRQLRGSYREARTRLSALNAFLAENILGMKVVNLFNRQALHRQRFAEINDLYANAQISSIRIYAYFQPAITWCSGIAMALVIWFGGQRALQGQLKLGVLVAFFSYVLALFQPMRDIADKWNTFLSGLTAAERVFDVLDWRPELQAEEVTAEPQALEAIRGHIVFENVWFAYEDDRWVLRDFSLEIKAGEKIGIVGHTGAGKTTLISLLLRFYEPQRGRILLDGKDLREYDRRALRAKLGIVQQDVFLFSGSVEENLTLWRDPEPKAREAMAEVLQAAGMGERQSQLLERGANLSSGQKQVMAYARALVAGPSIWILDEATAHVDSESEAFLVNSLEKGSAGKTTLMIAHRLATVHHADTILVMHEGMLAEKGTHSELMTRNGLYARLYRYQNSLEAPLEASAEEPA